MPRYKFTGSVETVLFGLRHGIEAVLHRDNGTAGGPVGSTVVACPGDVVETKAPYPHAWMALVDDDEDGKKAAAAAKRAAKAAAKKAAALAASSVVSTPVAAPVALPEGESR